MLGGDLGFWNYYFTTRGFDSIQYWLHIRIGIQVNHWPIGTGGFVEVAIVHQSAAYVHRVRNREHAHLQVGEIERYHLDVEDRLVEGLRPIYIGSWDLEPADSVFEYHNANVRK